jgi:SNF2 family DNA or RNA helicase
LTTLAQAARSPRENIVHQIPEKLRLVRTLILCPAGLLTNWCEEFAKWNKDRVGIGKPFVIDAQTKKDDRLKLLDEWYETGHGGVLLMGYSFFRKWALNPKPKHGERPFTPEQHEQIKKQLLNGPTIVITDEAHNMKNNDAGVTKAARLLKTKSRIALTGSPLSNNLKEYYSMVDFIAPGYLGEMVQFKANYVEPIEEGMTVDSTYAERKKARVKTAALIEILEPKIHRKDVLALQDELPPRVQFVLKIPLTSTQMAIYSSFVKRARSDIGNDTSNARLWGFIAYMQLLCSHPTLFHGAAKAARAKIDKEKAKLAADRAKRAKSPIKRVQQLQDEVCIPLLSNVHVLILNRVVKRVQAPKETRPIVRTKSKTITTTMMVALH